MSPFSNVHVKFDFAVLQYAFYCYYVIFLSLQSLQVLSMVQDPTFLTKSSYKLKILIKILTNYKVIPESSCFYFQPLKAKGQMPPGISPRCMTAVAPPRKPLGMKKLFARCPGRCPPSFLCPFLPAEYAVGSSPLKYQADTVEGMVDLTCATNPQAILLQGHNRNDRRPEERFCELDLQATRWAVLIPGKWQQGDCKRLHSSAWQAAITGYQQVSSMGVF